MAATSLEAIRRITIEATEKGLADVAAKLDKVAKAQEGVAATATTVEKSSGSVEQAFKKTERSLDTNVVAYNRYASAVKAVADAQAQGLVTQQRSAELFSLADGRAGAARTH
jgi:ABC-type Na+ efflux pump permease subunit